MGFKEDVEEGLKANPKALPSRYFYDAEGDRLFQEIMNLPEYYLTNSEFEILSQYALEIVAELDQDQRFDLVEFGAGDGLKTKILISKLVEAGIAFRYIPIDISGDVLKNLQNDLRGKFPDLEVLPKNADYFQAMEELALESPDPKLVLFLGSSIGNFSEERNAKFLRDLYSRMRPKDHLLIGYDLKKNPKIILDAYNDSQGITEAFNLNLLSRINRELGANFNLEAFDHYPLYDPESGAAKSYIVSTKAQTVFINELNLELNFANGEVIHTEISQKYSLNEIEESLKNADFSLVRHFFDCKHYFVDTLVQKK